MSTSPPKVVCQQYHQYGLSDPVLMTDPSGRDPLHVDPVNEGIPIHTRIEDNFIFSSWFWPGYEPYDVKKEQPVPGGSKQRRGRKGSVKFDLYEYEDIFLVVPGSPTSGNEGKIDIVDYRAREIYEIKTVASSAEGRAELHWYLAALNTRLPGPDGSIMPWGPGSRVYPEHKRNLGPWPTAPWNAFVDVVAWIDHGVILYTGEINDRRVAAGALATMAAGAALYEWLKNRGKTDRPPLPVPGTATISDGSCFLPSLSLSIAPYYVILTGSTRYSSYQVSTPRSMPTDPRSLYG